MSLPAPRLAGARELLGQFDPLAMVHPKGDKDVQALLQEALDELAVINRTLDTVFRDCEATKRRAG